MCDEVVKLHGLDRTDGCPQIIDRLLDFSVERLPVPFDFGEGNFDDAQRRRDRLGLPPRAFRSNSSMMGARSGIPLR